MEAVLPELVTTDEEGFKQVNYSKLPLLLLQSVRELKQENDLLKQQAEAAEKQNAELRRRLAAIEKTLEKLVKQ